MVGWHHRLNRHEFEHILGDGEGQGGLVCCSPWGCKESDTTYPPSMHTRIQIWNWCDTKRDHVITLPCLLQFSLYSRNLIKSLSLLLFSCSVMSNSFMTPQTIAHRAPLSMGFSRQESWSGLPCPSPGDLPNPGIEPVVPALAGRLFTAALSLYMIPIQQ